MKRNLWKALLLAALVLLIGRDARSHDAPSGWKYPGDCCSNKDCKPVTCDSISETSTGFIQGGLTYRRDQVRASGDQSCHACASSYEHNGKPGRTPHCLFILPST